MKKIPIMEKVYVINISAISSDSVRLDSQGSHRLEKHLIIQDCLENSLKIRFALKSTQNTHSKALKSP